METETDHSSTSSTTDLPNIRELFSPKKGWECGICGFQSLFKTSLINHQAVHSDARPFKCPSCEYAAKRKYDLKKHIQLKHAGCDPDPNLIGQYGGFQDGLYGSVVSSSVPSSRSENHFTPVDFTQIRDDLNSGQTISVPSYHGYSTSNPSLKTTHLLNVPNVKLEPQDDKDEEDRMTSSNSPTGIIEKQSLRPQNVCVTDFKTNLKNKLLPPEKYPSSIQSPKSFPVNESLFNAGRETDFSLFKRKYNSQETLADRPFTGCNNRAESSNFPKRLRRFSSSVDNPTSSTSLQSGTLSQSEVSCSSVKVDKQSDTRKTFSCCHCDILYFDQALYLMHMGLHNHDDPWRCAVCGAKFSEKYSFTSHFINQHSNSSLGE